MKIDIEISIEEFLKLPTEEIQRIVLEKNRPQVGIFVPDGNRHLIICQTRLSPNSDEFYKEYARFFADSLKKSLRIFFSHGLSMLLFPLFGPSLLIRKNKFQSITIPDAYQKIFQSEEWFQLYKEMGIRVKAYGDISQLEKIDILKLNMIKGIQETIEKTANHNKHTLFFGFMSENTPDMGIPQLIINFYKSNNRPPTPGEMIEIYYGEPVPPADFFIFSDKISAQGTLPPFLANRKAKMYYLPVPGFLAFDALVYRKILYDLLFLQPWESIAEYSDDELDSIETLNRFYQSHKNTIIGTVKKIGKHRVPDI